jgi:hypothetical protein
MEAALDFDWQDIKWKPEGSEGNAVSFDSKRVEGWEVVDISRKSGDRSFAPQDTGREGDWQLRYVDKHSDGPGRHDISEALSQTTNNDVPDDDRGEVVDPSASTHTAKSVSTAGLQPRASSPCTIAGVTNDSEEVTCAMPGCFRIPPPNETKPRSKLIQNNPELISHGNCPLTGEGKITQERPFVGS